MKEFASPQYRLSVVNDYASLWKAYFQFFQEKEGERKFTPEEEKGFEDCMLGLSQNFFRFSEAVGTFMKSPKKVMAVMDTTPTLAILHAMSDATFSMTQIDWHTLFIAMNKALGKLILMQPKPKA